MQIIWIKHPIAHSRCPIRTAAGAPTILTSVHPQFRFYRGRKQVRKKEFRHGPHRKHRSIVAVTGRGLVMVIVWLFISWSLPRNVPAYPNSLEMVISFICRISLKDDRSASFHILFTSLLTAILPCVL
jgi:hypothetical protein